MSLEKAATNGNQRLNETDSASNGSPMQLPTSAVPSLGLEISKIQRSIHSEQYIEAFTHSTTIVNELFDTAIRVIDLRAHISKKTSNNRQELEDALLLTKIDSQNYRSFLRAAKIYSIQGNQEDASKVLQKGIDVCLNKVHCGLLHQQLEVVQSQMNRRVDFVVQFPSEILCNILSHFDMAMVATCMDVCRLWRHKLLQCPVPWRIVDISTKNPSLPVVNRVLPTIAPHIRELHVFGAKFMDPWIGFFRQYNFSGLRTVRLDTGSGDNHNSLCAPLYAAFSYLAKTLTDLRIRLSWMTDFSLAHLLSCCRNLTVLHWSARRITESFDEEPLTYTTSLISVHLETSTDPFNVSKLGPLFQYSPYLRHISLNTVTDDILPMLGSHCSRIQAIESASMILDESIEDNCEKIVADIISGKSIHGIQFILVGKVRSVQPLYTQLENSQDSLKYMHLQPIDNGTSTDWKPLLFNVMNGLSYLNFDLGKKSTIFRDHIPAILRNCPNLEVLVLDNWYENERQLDVVPAAATHKILDAIADIKKLHRLSLSLFDVRSQRFVRLLKHYMIQGESCTIKTLGVNMCPGLAASVLFQIGNIVSLESLSIYFGDTIQVSRPEVTELMRMVKHLPKLVHLELGGIELTYGDAQHLSESGTLKEVMTMEVAMPAEAIDLLEQRFPKLIMYD